MNTLRLLPAAHAAEHAPHIAARGGWVMTDLAADLCGVALGRSQTLALCDDGPEATPEEVDRIRGILDAHAHTPGDLGGTEARGWATRLEAEVTRGQ